MTSFEQWWFLNGDHVEENCDNRMDEHDAKYWLERAFEEGKQAGIDHAVSWVGSPCE